MKFPLTFLRFFPVWVALSTIAGAQSTTTPSTDLQTRGDPAYRLVVDDEIAVSVFGEPDLTVVQKIDSQGRVRLALIGDVPLAGKSIREAENSIEMLYVQRKILKQPMVTLALRTYAARDVSILGAVRQPGKVTFPPEKTTLDIVEVVTRAGGFTPVARSDAVKITRVAPDGKETTIELNVEAMLTRRGSNSSTPKEYLILPGDRIWVPERLF